jgi:uncharacterized SAM-binding protein YcdF (DUF218 family)
MLMFLKKLFSRLLFPIPLGIELLAGGLIVWRFTRFKRLGITLVVAGTVWMAVIGYGWIPKLLLPVLTEQHPPLSAERLREARPAWVVVPGMGIRFESGYPANLRFPVEFILRLLEAVRVHRLCPDSRILVSVSNSDMTVAEKERAVADLMEILRVDSRNVTVLVGLGDTEEEIREFKRRSGDGLVCLVSSAANLPRAMILARRHGLNALASPSSPRGNPAGPESSARLQHRECLSQRGESRRHRVGLLRVSGFGARTVEGSDAKDSGDRAQEFGRRPMTGEGRSVPRTTAAGPLAFSPCPRSPRAQVERFHVGAAGQCFDAGDDHLAVEKQLVASGGAEVRVIRRGQADFVTHDDSFRRTSPSGITPPALSERRPSSMAASMAGFSSAVSSSQCRNASRSAGSRFRISCMRKPRDQGCQPIQPIRPALDLRRRGRPARKSMREAGEEHRFGHVRIYPITGYKAIPICLRTN